MSGRELILYILENHLENEQVYSDGKLIGFMNEGEAAERFGVGIPTLCVWIDKGLLPAIKIDQRIFIPANATNPKELVSGKSTTKSVMEGKLNHV